MRSEWWVIFLSWHSKSRLFSNLITWKTGSHYIVLEHKGTKPHDFLWLHNYLLTTFNLLSMSLKLPEIQLSSCISRVQNVQCRAIHVCSRGRAMSALPRSHKQGLNLQGTIPTLLTQARSDQLKAWGVFFLAPRTGVRIWNCRASRHVTVVSHSVFCV